MSWKDIARGCGWVPPEEVNKLRGLIRRAMEHGVNGNDYYDALKAGDLGDEMRAVLSVCGDSDG